MRRLLLVLLAGACFGQEAQVLRFELRDARVDDAVRMLSELSELKLVASRSAGQTRVSASVRALTGSQAVAVICKAAGLWFKEDADGLIRILTSEEYQQGIVIERTDYVKVFTMLYPNASSVAQTIADLYGGRVRLSLGLANESSDFLSQVDGDVFSGTRNQRFRAGSQGSSGNNLERGRLQDAATEQLAARVNPQGSIAGEDLEELVGAGSPIFISVERSHNLIAVRSSESGVLEDIERLILELDRPTPQVLLEVKILELNLDEGFDSVFDFDLTEGPAVDGPSSGAARNPLLGGAARGREDVLGLGNFPLEGGTLIYQFMNEHVRARVQMLQTEGRMRVLATPLLLCANGQPARLFVGEERPLVRNFQLQTTSTEGVVSDRVIPEIDLREIGNTLRIFPGINADRSVNLRIIQDVSSVNVGGALLPVPTNDGQVQELRVDTVTTANIEGTVIGKDGLTLAIGGLIRKEMTTREEGIPVLMDIPLLGILFRSTELVETQRELILLITPHVLSTPAEGEAKSRARLRALSLHPYHSQGDAAVSPFDRADGADDPNLFRVLSDFLEPSAEPLP